MTPPSDPLFGPAAPAAASRPKSTASTQPTVAPASASPGMPSPYLTTGSTAALAAGNTPTLNPDSNLRIPSSAGGRAVTAPPTATLAPPVPDPAASRAGPGPQPPAPPAAPLSAVGNITTYEQAQAQLQARGVKWQRLETDPQTGEWHFIGSVPNAQNPNINRTYDARAGDQVAVLRAVVEQIDRER